MTSVFIGGSRTISRLNETLRKQLDDFIAKKCVIYVGDANGADKAVQQHFASRGYAKVVVYCMDRCRNNLGAWPTKQIQRPGAAKDFAYYAAKDLAMAQDAQCGMMLWDGESKGTLNNIQNLLQAGKKVLVYLAPEQSLTKITYAEELESQLLRCDGSLIAEARRRIEGLAGARQLRLARTDS